MELLRQILYLIAAIALVLASWLITWVTGNPFLAMLGTLLTVIVFLFFSLSFWLDFFAGGAVDALSSANRSGLDKLGSVDEIEQASRLSAIILSLLLYLLLAVALYGVFWGVQPLFWPNMGIEFNPTVPGNEFVMPIRLGVFGICAVILLYYFVQRFGPLLYDFLAGFYYGGVGGATPIKTRERDESRPVQPTPRN